MAATFGWLCVETEMITLGLMMANAATFGWLCVETLRSAWLSETCSQPPSGGCVLKQELIAKAQALNTQPPSGGCVLKQMCMIYHYLQSTAATFGWLCVETIFASRIHGLYTTQPPSGGCVLKRSIPGAGSPAVWQPPSGGCVLKHHALALFDFVIGAATFGWLCVETYSECRYVV